MTTWNELPPHLLKRINKNSPTKFKQEIAQEEKQNKYSNEKTIVDGIKFDSKKEAKFYSELKLLKRIGDIKHIELQPSFTLQESYKHLGKTVRAIVYKADFMVTESNGHIYVVDVKGMKTPVYLLKKKMLLHRFPDMDFREV